jgi:hypothetical protein
MVVSIASEKMSPFHFPKTAASPDPTMIPETESGNVLNRAAFNQAFIFMRFFVYKWER